jgi:hypothetical protein
MGRPCSICEDPQRETIEEAIVAGRSFRSVAATFGTFSKDAVRRHRESHMPVSLVRIGKKAVDSEATEARSLTVLVRMEGLYGRLTGILDRAEDGKRDSISLQAAREMRATAEVIAKISGELREQPSMVVNLQASPEWLMLRSGLLRALERHPEALADVRRVLEASNT